MTQSRRALIAIGVVTLIVGILVLFPARVAYQWFAPEGVALSGIEGTVWSGRASEATINALYLSDIKWTFDVRALMSAAIGVQLEAKPVSGFVESTLRARPGGTIQLLDLTASMPLAVLGSAIQVNGLSGSASLQFDRIDIDNMSPEVIDGTLTVGNLRVPLVAGESLGGYRAVFSTQETGISASVEDTDNVLDLAASLTIRSDRSYDLNGLVVATSSTPPTVRQRLEFLGPANERGQRELRFGGAY